MASIEFCGVGKRYGDGTEAVKAMSLTITDGELMVFVGPSGCGKTTALRMVAGLETITEGELLIDGTRVNELDPKARDIAMVFQNYALYPYLTVRQNMGFPLKLSGAPKAVIREKVEGVARILDLEAHLDRKPANLSGGQRQRVAMGRAIVRNPKAFLMDEPLSNLDAKLRVQMRTEIERLQRELATTTIYVTHDQTEAMTLGDRVAVMRDGVIQQIGPPRQLYDQPANVFVAGFIGSPAMNFLAGSIDGDRLRMPIGMVALPDHLRQVIDRTGAKRLVCGFRPEHVEDATLIGPEKLDRGISFITRVELVEEMGSDRLAYFSVGDAVSATVDGVSAVAVSDGAASRLVARLDPDADVAERREARLWLDLAKLRVFDADSGEALGSFGGARATVASA